MHILKDIAVQDHRWFDAHERVMSVENQACGLKAYIALHNTRLGPALGGVRMYNYRTEDDAVKDALLLSRGMTYKCALAGLPLGGGHAVIVGNPGVDKSEDMLRSFGAAVEELAGGFIAAEDSGTNMSDMETIARETSHAVGLPYEACPGEFGGPPAPYAARGVYIGMKRAAKRKFGVDSLSGLRVAVQGLGEVGFALCELLLKEGAQIVGCDIHEDRITRARDAFPGMFFIEPATFFSLEADIYAPCALGQQLNSDSIPQMHFGMICGGANNQLHQVRHDQWLKDRDILYVPDYTVNSGATIEVSYEHYFRAGQNPFDYDLTLDALDKHIARIADTVDSVLDFAEEYDLPTGEAADSVAEKVFLGGG